MDATDPPPAPAPAADAHGGDTADEGSAVESGTHLEDAVATDAHDGDTANEGRAVELGNHLEDAGADEHAEDVDQMVSDMGGRLGALPGKPRESEPFTIFRVAGAMRDRNKHLYEPQMVSIGPFHRGAERLRAMEEHKWRYLRDLLSRNSDAPLRDYARAARALVPRARRCYSESVPLSDREFAEMLLLDGCFVLEFFLKGEDRAADALIDAAWASQNAYNDLFLLENQIPFFVLEHLHGVFTGGLDRDHLVIKVLAKYLTMDGPQKADEARPPAGEIHHLLHLYYHWFLPPEEHEKEMDPDEAVQAEDAAYEAWAAKPVDERTPMRLPGAAELQSSGVKIRPKKSPRSLFDLAFDARQGVLEIPAVENYANRTMFANLLAYEQSRGRWEMQRLMSYVLLMSSLVGGRGDVEVLQRAEVFTSGDDETATFYTHLGELCPMPDLVNNYYAELFRDVKKYCDQSWNRHIAMLKQEYCGNPWATMSAVAAVFLLILTVLQTVYTVYPYYYPNLG